MVRLSLPNKSQCFNWKLCMKSKMLIESCSCEHRWLSHLLISLFYKSVNFSNNNIIWVFTSQNSDTIMGDTIVKRSGTFNHLVFFQVHYHIALLYHIAPTEMCLPRPGKSVKFTHTWSDNDEGTSLKKVAWQSDNTWKSCSSVKRFIYYTLPVATFHSCTARPFLFIPSLLRYATKTRICFYQYSYVPISKP